MKARLFLTALLSLYFSLLSSQVPQGFNYQAIARDGSGNPITGATMQVKIGILSDTILNTMVWEELFNPVKTNAYGMFTVVVGTGVKQSGSAPSFSTIDWTKTPLFLRTSIYYPTVWKTMGTSKLQSVPYSMAAGNLAGAVPLLSVKGNTTTMDSALFVVRNNTGQIVFAVYNEGVRIYVDDGVAKGSRKGGFAIGSFDKSKGTSQPLFVVDPDSIRAYLDNNPTKAVKGGFAIGGFDKSKLIGNQQLFMVSVDSVRVYIDDNLSKGSTKGGFAIGSFDKSKGGNISYLNVAPDSTGRVFPSQNRILWYPLKDALLEGRVIAENKDSVGAYSFASGYETRSKGKYSQALGYKAIARGDYSTAIGKNALANKINSFAFGDSSRATNSESYAIGRGAVASGYRSFAFGSAGIDSAGHATDVARAIGDYSFAMGQGSRSTGTGAFSFGIADTATGKYSVSIGYGSKATMGGAIALGHDNRSTNSYSTTIGNFSNSSGFYSIVIGCAATASGSYSTAIGFGARASGDWSTAMGPYTIAPSWCETAIGSYNTNYTPASTYNWKASDRLFVIGNGTNISATSNALTILKNGNVGIGTSTPLAKLEIDEGSGDRLAFYRDEDNVLNIQTLLDGVPLSSYGNYGGDLENRLILQPSVGNVGVGTFTPAYKLDVSGDIRSSGDILASNKIWADIGGASTSYFRGGNDAELWDVNVPNTLAIYGVENSAVATLRLGSSAADISGSGGNIGIGTTTPQGKIAIKNGTYGGLLINVVNGGSWLGSYTNIQTGDYAWASGATASNLYLQGKGGQVGIGALLTGGYELYVNGTAYSTGGWAGSDIRWKKNIIPLTDVLDKLLNLTGVNYEWKKTEFPEINFDSGQQIGLIAQEVEKIFPQLVRTDKNGYKAVSYEKLSVLLLEGLKEQQKEIDELKTLVNSLVANQSGQGNK